MTSEVKNSQTSNTRKLANLVLTHQRADDPCFRFSQSLFNENKPVAHQRDAIKSS